jgi:outer membrane protein OmpA-like peptidoglycan-associated protein
VNSLIKVPQAAYLLLFLTTLIVKAQDFEHENELLHGLNSPFDEHAIMIKPDGSQMAYSRGNHPYNHGGKFDEGDIWFSNFQDSAWSVGTNWHQINNEHYTSPIGWSSDGKTFIYSLVKTKGGLLETELWALSGNNAQKLDVQYFKNKSPHQSGCLSSDNRFIILSMESGATEGVEDLYVLVRDGESWSSPKNLGPTINTKYQEITPFLSPDTKTLYFATNGRKGIGSFDIYASDRLDDTWRNWSTPRNLGSSVNSPGKETSFAYSLGADYAYFISTRDSDGYGDIRRIKFRTDSLASAPEADTTEFFFKEMNTLIVGLQVVNAKTSRPLTTPVEVKQNDIITVMNPTNEGWLDLSGEDWIEVSAKGFMSGTIQLQKGNLTVLRLEPLEVGRTIRLEHVLFHRGTSTIMDESSTELDRVVRMMNENGEIRILLKGHTDGNGDPGENLKLSQDRVETVRKYLIQKGINKKRITGKGFGGEQPIADNDTEETRKLNRRVEFEVIK